MNEITVTMPMSQYEFEKEIMEKLERERITNFLKTEYISFEKDEYTVSVDMDKLNEFLDKHKTLDVDHIKDIYTSRLSIRVIVFITRKVRY